ncbi:MAG: carboxylesterase family protein [Burkholderiales bacterium]|nr:carboxylesterase family protein [Burkholderiales bacterium]
MTHSPDPATRRRLAGGEVVGSRESDGTLAWRGLRYAQPPTGERRWRAPQPPAPWQGVAEALAHGPMAPQVAGLLSGLPPKTYGQLVGDEDCLSLNVFAPPPTAESRPPRPVMVWVHGGGYAVGTSALYDAARKLALHDDVVVVTVNYRLGVLGWFTHPALAEADGATPEERSGNFGTLDQIAALRWVRDNIAAFGGDAGCVTVFGESAGGQAVLTLLASPLAAGLFHRAVAQSPVAETFSVEAAVHRSASPLASRQCTTFDITARLWAAASRSPDAAAAHAALAGARASEVAAFLRSLTPAQLLAPYAPGSVGIYLAPRPTRDGVVLPLAPLAEVFASGPWNRMPVILGSNRDEVRTFLADKPEHSRLLGGKLPLLHDRPAYLAESRYQSRAWRALHVDAMADAMLAGGHRDLWTYRFDWDEAPAIPFVRPDLLLGAAHAMEMPFAFHDPCEAFDPFTVATPFNRASRQALAEAMGTAWSSFARHGEPRLPDLAGRPAAGWARRAGGSGADSLVFDSARDGGLRMAAARESIGTIKRELAADPALQARPDLLCAIYARLFLWHPLFEGHGDEAEYRQWAQRLGCAIPAEAFRPRVEV